MCLPLRNFFIAEAILRVRIDHTDCLKIGKQADRAGVLHSAFLQIVGHPVALYIGRNSRLLINGFPVREVPYIGIEGAELRQDLVADNPGIDDASPDFPL